MWMLNTIARHTFVIESDTAAAVTKAAAAAAAASSRDVATGNIDMFFVTRDERVALSATHANLAWLRARVFGDNATSSQSLSQPPLTNAAVAMSRYRHDYARRLLSLENGFARCETVCDVLNRSSVKLAEMDYALTRFTASPLFPDCKLRLLDLCCAPGEFIDYSMYRRYWSLDVTGVTLRWTSLAAYA